MSAKKVFKAIGTFFGSIAGAAVIVQGVAGLFGSISINLFDAQQPQTQDDAITASNEVDSFESPAVPSAQAPISAAGSEKPLPKKLVQQANSKKTASRIVLINNASTQPVAPVANKPQTPMAAPVEPPMAAPTDAVTGGSGGGGTYTGGGTSGGNGGGNATTGGSGSSAGGGSNGGGSNGGSHSSGHHEQEHDNEHDDD